LARSGNSCVYQLSFKLNVNILAWVSTVLSALLFRTIEKDAEVSILVKKMQERIQKSIVRVS
jgi:hypothetical protein